MGEKLQLISHREAHCLSNHLYSGSSFSAFIPLFMSEAGPSVGASGGSVLWLWQAAGSEREVERTGILLMKPMRRTRRACGLQEGLEQAPADLGL